MRRLFLSVAAALIAAGGASAGEAPPPLPESFSYTILVAGKRVGGSRARVTYAKGEMTIDCSAWLDVGQGATEISCQAEVDPRTSRPVRLRYQGIRPEASFHGTVDVAGDTMFSHHTEGDRTSTRSAVSPGGGIVLLEDYVIATQVLLARTLALSDEGGTQNFGLAFASTGALLAASAAFVSETVVESATQETVCRRLVVELASGSAFMSYYDSGRGLPVYLAFPGSATEAFLDSFYGEAPQSRWQEPSGGAQPHNH